MLRFSSLCLILTTLVYCFAFISCDEAKQMMEPVMPTDDMKETPQQPPVVETPQQPPVVGTPQQPPVVETPQQPPVVETPQQPPVMQQTSSPVTISEIMYGSERSFSPKQWIEISNSGTDIVDLTGWTLTVQNVDSDDLTGPVTATIDFRDTTFEDAPRIWPNDVLMIVTSSTDENSGGFMEDQIYDLRWIEGARKDNLDIDFNTIWLSAEGFRITLTDADGNVVDEVGNYDGTTTLWNLPYGFNRGRTRSGNRTSLIRKYENGVALDGTLESSWVSAADANLTEDQLTYYGDENDISSPGILGTETGE